MRYFISLLVILIFVSSGSAQQIDTKLIFVKIPDPILPIERGKKYEDPIDLLMQQAGLGSVSGGGTQLSKDNQVLWVGVDVDVLDIDRALPTLKDILKKLNAPQGTVLECYYADRIVEIPLYNKK